jgi:hypothetical protein
VKKSVGEGSKFEQKYTRVEDKRKSPLLNFKPGSSEIKLEKR